MMLKKIFLFPVFCLLAIHPAKLHAQVSASASGGKLSEGLMPPKFSVSEAPEWTALFQRSSGWFGGDGIFSIPLNGRENGSAAAPQTLFVFSDSMIGEIRDGKLQPGYHMIHNSAALLTGQEPKPERLNFYWNKMGKTDSQPIFKPETPNTRANDYYWLGDGFVNQALNNSIFIFGYRVRNVGQGTFGFEEAGNTLIKIRTGQNLPYQGYEQKDTPFYYSKEQGEMGSFGAGILVNTSKAGAAKGDGFIYVYGVRGKAKNLLVARVLPKDFENFGKWVYWDGTKWVSEIAQAAVVTNGVSNELSVSALADGRFALVFQEGGMGKYVSMRIGRSPYGPFSPAIRLWDCTSALTSKTYFSYNAKAHPSLSKEGELLISYNVNSFDFFKDLEKDPQLYRPRFIRVRFQK